MTDPVRAALTGCCPRCGKGPLFAGFVKFAPSCRNCGLDYQAFNVGDGPAAFLTLIIGIIVVFLAMWLELSEAIPEVALHRFLESTGVPYRAFEAEDPKELGRAIEDIDRLEKHTIVTTAIAPRRELAGWWFAIAAGCAGLLALARARQAESWGLT